MWQWIKSTIFKPIANFFSGIITPIWNWFTSNPPYQAIPSDIPLTDTTLLLREMPVEISQHEILPRLTTKDLVSLASTSKPNLSFFQKLLSMIAKPAHYIVVKPSVPEVQKILNGLDAESLKKFLQGKIDKVIDQSNRIIHNNTLLQLAYGAGDDEMCLEIEKYFIKAFGSEEAARAEMRKQLDEKFPKNEEEQKKQETSDLEVKNKLAALLTAVIQAISLEQFNHGKDKKGRLKLSAATLQAIKAFRTGFDALHPKIIDWGMHYRSQSTREVFKAYFQEARQWRYDYSRCVLFEDGVLAKVLEHTPGNDAERFSQGLYHLQKSNPEVFNRALKTREGHHFYTYLRGESQEFGLLGACIDILHGQAEGGWFSGRGEWVQDVAERRRVANLFSNKDRALGDFTQRVRQRPEQTGAITAPRVTL